MAGRLRATAGWWMKIPTAELDRGCGFEGKGIPAIQQHLAVHDYRGPAHVARNWFWVRFGNITIPFVISFHRLRSGYCRERRVSAIEFLPYTRLWDIRDQVSTHPPTLACISQTSSSYVGKPLLESRPSYPRAYAAPSLRCPVCRHN